MLFHTCILAFLSESTKCLDRICKAADYQPSRNRTFAAITILSDGQFQKYFPDILTSERRRMAQRGLLSHKTRPAF